MKNTKCKSIKKIISFMMAFALLLGSLVLFQPDLIQAAPKNSITLEKKYTSLYAGESYTLKATAMYQNGELVASAKKEINANALANKFFRYESSNKSVATVSKKGVVTAKKKGNTTITMSSIYNSKVKATIKLKVKAKAKKTKIELNSKKATVVVGNAVTIGVKKVTGLSGKDVKFSSSNKKIATVSEKGVVVGKKEGTATITVTSALNKKAKTTFKVTVITADMEGTIYNPSGEGKIVLAENEVTLAPYDSFKTYWGTMHRGNMDWNMFYKEQQKKYGQSQIKVKSISGVSSKAVSYTSSDNTIAEVSSTGLVTPKRAGMALITVTSKADKNIKTTYKVIVRNLVTGVKVNSYCELRFEPQGTDALYNGKYRSVGWFYYEDILPDNADNKNVKVISDNENVIKPIVKYNNGKFSEVRLIAIGKGEANLTVKSEDGFFEATWNIKVSDGHPDTGGDAHYDSDF